VNYVKFFLELQDLPIHLREDAVSSMVYEAHARVRDPVYGCAGAVSCLQQQLEQLQTQLALAQAEIINLRMQRDHALLSNMTNAANNTTIGRLTTIQGTSPSSEASQQVRPFFLDANDSREYLWK
jgi:hypothetical protein